MSLMEIVYSEENSKKFKQLWNKLFLILFLSKTNNFTLNISCNKTFISGNFKINFQY